MIGYAFCGSFCTLSASLFQMEKLVLAGCDIQPIVSEKVYSTDTRFFASKDFIERVEGLSSKKVIRTVEDAEPFGSIRPLEYLIISPCTGNTLAKIANGITDTAVTMAAKAHLRCDRPLLIALASNDAMSANLSNISKLLIRKNIYFVPMCQDDPEKKPHSLVADFSQVSASLDAALEGKQIRKMFL